MQNVALMIVKQDQENGLFAKIAVCGIILLV